MVMGDPALATLKMVLSAPVVQLQKAIHALKYAVMALIFILMNARTAIS